MKKNSIIATVFGIAGSILLVSMPLNKIINNSKNINLNKNYSYKDSYVYEVTNYEQFKNALMDQNNQNKEIVLQNDISLENVESSDLNLNVPYSQKITIDGQGYSIKNKPTDLFFIPIIGQYVVDLNSNSILSNGLQNFTIKNLTLDNVGSFIGLIEMQPMYDIELSNSNHNGLLDLGISFQNIVIKNNYLNYKTISTNGNIITSNNVVNSQLSPLLNTIYFNKMGSSTDDLSISFYNIHVENNLIENNSIIISEDVDVTSFSFLSNIVFNSNGSQGQNNQSFINYEYIFMNDNTFKDNVYVSSNDPKKVIPLSFESASNLIGSVQGLDDSDTYNSNHIFMSNIFISNNVIGSSKNITKDQFTYSELLATFGDNYNQGITFDSFENIVSINNKSFYYENGREKELNYYDNVSIINLENNHSNIDYSNLYFYGNMFNFYSDLNLFVDYIGNSNSINFGQYLKTDSDEILGLIDFLNENIGIYSYKIKTTTNIDNTGNEEEVLEGIEIISEDYIDIKSIDFNPVTSYKDDYGIIVDNMQMNFKMYLKFDIDNEPIVEPYTLSDLQLSNGSDEVYATSSEIISTSLDNNYVYQTIFDFEESFLINTEWLYENPLDNVYLEFNTNSSSKELKEPGNGFDQSFLLNQEQLINMINDSLINPIAPIFPPMIVPPLEIPIIPITPPTVDPITPTPVTPGTTGEKSNNLILSISIITLLLILIFILILILIFSSKSKKSREIKESENQIEED